MNIPSFKTIRASILCDLKNLLPQAKTEVDSDNYIRATATASAIEGNYQHQEWILKQAFPDSADMAYLERHCAAHNIYRKPATLASGMVRFTGEPLAVIPVGTTVQTVDEKIYTVTNQVQIKPDGFVDVPVLSAVMGTAGNLPDQTAVKLTSAPVGIDSEAVMLFCSGGANAETQEALLARLLDKLRQPAAGGNAHDYYVWAMSVKGVTAAYVYPLRRGLGTVDIVIISENELPSKETLEACQRYIDSVRPVTAKNALVMAPDIQKIDVHIKLKLLESVDQAATQQAVHRAVIQYFKQSVPAQDFIKSQLEAAVSGVYGVIDREVILPKGNVTAEVSANAVTWLRVGKIKLEQLP